MSDQWRRMNRLALVLLACLLSVSGAATAFLVGVERMADESSQSTFTYSVELEPSANLTNVTLLLPLPDPRPDSFGGNFSVLADGAQDWSFGIQETDEGPMLALTAPRLEPGVTRAGTLVSFTWSPDAPIETRAPVGREPVLAPRAAEAEAPCEFARPVEWDETLRCTSYGTAVFASYEAPENATLRVRVDLVGANEWWALGEGGNSYRERVQVELRDGREAWRATRGTLVAGEGTYRD